MFVAILIGAIVLLTGAAASVYFAATRTRLKELRRNLEKAAAHLDLLLKQRYDELPKLAGTCRGYMEDDAQPLRAVREARHAWARASTLDERMRMDAQLTTTLESLFAAAANYPDLGANSDFRQLHSRLRELGEKFAAEKITYNERVSDFNARLGQMPAKLLARLAGLAPCPQFGVVKTDTRT
jgi:LemA protein